jgi:RNA polymerase sigma-70 factor (ECF subfamily)
VTSPGGVDQAAASDDALLRRLRARDESALEALYDRYSGLVFTLALRIVGDRHLAEEVLQDTFWRCWSGAEQFDPARGRPASWLVGVARNRAIDLLRSRQHQARLREHDDPKVTEGSMEPKSHAVGGGDAQEAFVLRDTIGTALNGLSTPQRQAIELAYYGGLSQSEIARTLGVPLGTVKARMRDGMEKLRTTLRPLFASDAPGPTP